MKNQLHTSSSLQNFLIITLLLSFIANGGLIITVSGQSTVNIAVSLSTSGVNTAGETYSLECSANVTRTTNQSTINITWLDLMNNPVSSRLVTTISNTSTLTFNPLAATDAGAYTCSVRAESTIQNATAFVTVKNPTIIVRIDGDASPTMVGSMYSLTCIITGAERLTDSTITFQWFIDGETVAEQTTETLSFSSLTLSDAGSYNCQATVMSALLSNPVTNTSAAFILSDIITHMPTTDSPTTAVSNPAMTTTISPPSVDDVRLSFQGNPIANNSIVLISDIGDNMDNRILCITSNPECCTRSTNRLGFWYFPSGREVTGRSSSENIYRVRSSAESKSSTKLNAVMLGRRDVNASGPTGLYRCVIPDRFGVDQTFIIGIYSSHENMAEIAPLTNSFQLTSISAQSSANITFSLTCNSSGGPVQSVEWMRDGFPLDNTGPLILTNTSTASYTNTLDVSGRLPGTYTCQIRGSDNQILNSVDVAINGSAPPLNVQATRSSSSALVELNWSPPSTLEDITGYRVFYGNGQSILVPSYVTSIIFNFVDNQDEVDQTVSVRSESLHLLPSELTNVMVTDESVSTAMSVACFSEMTLIVAVSVTILATSGLTAIVVTVFMGLCSWKKKKPASKDEFAVSANVAYGLVNLEPETDGGGEYVIPDEVAIISSYSQGRYEAPVGHDSNLYDLPASQSASSQPVVYAVPHETTSRQTQSLDDERIAQ